LFALFLGDFQPFSAPDPLVIGDPALVPQP
jgi:hypothetical protein